MEPEKISFPHPIITLEEHWLSQSVRDVYNTKDGENPYGDTSLLSYIFPSLMDFGPKRLQSMDENNVTLQVVSHAANSIALDPETCIKVNDEMHAHIKSNPKGRFAGFATLPMAHPDAASKELTRCVNELGFLGALIDNQCAGRFYDDPFFWPVFATASDAANNLNVPIYLHPSPNEHIKQHLYQGNYNANIATTLSQYAWGWHSETALSFLRLYASGLFDTHPSLKLVLGHQGEMIPFQLERIEAITENAWPQMGLKLRRGLREVWDSNVWVTFGGMFTLTPFRAVLEQCKSDRIMYSVDYPFGSHEKGLRFLCMLKEKGVVGDEVLKGIAYGNAERLLGVKVKGG